ncbi:hypothetical protein AABM06_02605 [Listeria ivanovii]|uniref:hypothetical protein n=1 Tax=Listeria ivanovii TaxID=1638 RepID=UPI00165E39E6|nr:hypothetical protein [Listeria ivanovii]
MNQRKFLAIVSGEILQICLLKEITFSDNQFIPNYLARLILSFGLEISQTKSNYTNSDLLELATETFHFLTK